MQFELDLHFLCNAVAVSMISGNELFLAYSFGFAPTSSLNRRSNCFLLKQTVEASSVTEMAGMMNSCWIAEAILLRLHVVFEVNTSVIRDNSHCSIIVIHELVSS